ncbi:MAG: hypothetical protein A3D16_09945 [Rhodobacterales bacterium RIFCSPHIGHO2_02_FULL_62_130]|nr:MAG: hypothetical protein A3D16_09945 [Rhodobacterales bacterium RIFCSPHIGHO2_02_FULL_62_130]OHC56333.1 MAG: hypothetical protein A3E48_20870 [Rhodobacterales bacterium RIFCSPHIGHO2_12_FULL_62_75]
MGEGLASFQRRMQAIPEAVRRAVDPALLRGGEAVADAIRALAPVDEGALLASVTVTGPGQATPAYSQPGGAAVVPDNAAAVTVGNTDVRYPHLVEYGTTHAAAQPFFWPGFRLSRKKAAAQIKRGISKAIRGAK